ncbi:MAG: hypothetical protein PF447_06310 [Spirochaetaceae bacterium]|nr:hypothetical protein [Spirochaetaceae bacterium]
MHHKPMNEIQGRKSHLFHRIFFRIVFICECYLIILNLHNSVTADEEHRHYHLIDNIEELLLRPKQWVEDAEFNHLEDY